MRRVGVGYRRELAGWIAQRPPEIGCLEITAEHFFDGGKQLLRELSRDYPLFVHGLGLSLGTPGPLDAATLTQFAEVVETAEPQWISEHVSFTRSDEVDLGHLNPIRPDQRSLDVITEHACELMEQFHLPLLLENVTSYLRIEGDFREPDFLNRLCQQSGCGLLLDVANLFINSKNHGFDAIDWLKELECSYIRQLHVVGYSFHEDVWRDYHQEAIQDELFELLDWLLDAAPVESIIVERDSNFPGPKAMTQELKQLEAAFERHRPDCGAGETAE